MADGISVDGSQTVKFGNQCRGWQWPLPSVQCVVMVDSFN